MTVAAGIIASSYAAAGGSSFDPLSIAWLHAWWASDPSWSNPGDGNAVSSWRNAGTNGIAATQATGGNQPIYRAAYANLSSRPAVEFVSNDYVETTMVTSATAQPNHVYIVAYVGSTTGNPTPFDAGDSNNRHLVRFRSGSTLQLFAGASVTPGTALGTGGAQAAAYFNTTNSSFRVNGQNHTGLSVGSHGLYHPRIGADTSAANGFVGAIAFVGVKDTALTTQELDDLDAWAQSTYGVPAL